MHMGCLPKHWMSSQGQKDPTLLLKHTNSDASLSPYPSFTGPEPSPLLQGLSSIFPLWRTPNPEAESIAHCCFWPIQVAVDFSSSSFTQLICSLSWMPHFTWAAVFVRSVSNWLLGHVSGISGVSCFPFASSSHTVANKYLLISLLGYYNICP